MGNLEDVRKVIQDFVSPDLKALATRLDSLEKEMKLRFEHFEKRFEQAEHIELERFASAEKMAATRHETLLAIAAANHASVMQALDMDKRLTRLEGERKAEPQHA